MQFAAPDLNFSLSVTLWSTSKLVQLLDVPS